LYDSGFIPRNKKSDNSVEGIIDWMIAGIAAFTAIFLFYVVTNAIIHKHAEFGLMAWTVMATGYFMAIFFLMLVIKGKILGNEIKRIRITEQTLLIDKRSSGKPRKNMEIRLEDIEIMFTNEESHFPCIVIFYHERNRKEKDFFFLDKSYEIPDAHRFMEVLGELVPTDSTTFCNAAGARKMIREQRQVRYSGSQGR